MDVVSHALWGYASLSWRGPWSARLSALIGAAPDLLYFGADRLVRLVQHGRGALASNPARDPRIWMRDGPPLPPELEEAYQNYYVWTHSLVVLGMLAIAWVVLRRRAPWLLLPWLVHILMDIPTHEGGRYQTPFLFPLSMWTVEGYAWSRPPVFLVNVVGLVLTYAFIFWRCYWRPRRAPGLTRWPEEVSGVA